ncbi:MAG: SRPBCC family protein [Solirubrobacterales bacterium]
MEISFGEHPYPPAVVWQYFVDPEKRLRWQPLQTAVKNQPNQQGRLGPGASCHCAHGAGGDVLREYLDWRPYSYFTNRLTPLRRGPLFFPCIETIEFTTTDAGTMVHYRFRLKDCGPLTRLRFLIIRPGGRRVLSRSGKTLRRILDEDAATER